MSEFFACKTCLPTLQPPWRTADKCLLSSPCFKQPLRLIFFFFFKVSTCVTGDSLRLSRWEQARHMARGISLRTPPSGMSCHSLGPRRWLCPGCWTDRTGSRLPALPAPRTAPEHLAAEQKRIQVGGLLAYVNGVTDGGGSHILKHAESAETEFRGGIVLKHWRLKSAVSGEQQHVTGCCLNSVRKWERQLWSCLDEFYIHMRRK